MLTQSPQVRFGASETGTMHTGLLPRADANGLSTHDVTNGIGLCELERDPCDEHVSHGGFRQVFLLCHNVRKVSTSHWAVVATLFHTYAKDLTSLGQLRFVGWVNLNHGIFALFLFLQNLQRFRFVGGSDHAIGYFASDQLRGGHVHRIG